MGKVKKNLQKLMRFFLASLLAVGSLPLDIISVYAVGATDAADSPTVVSAKGLTDAPAHEKKLVDNGDGTYTLSLSVTGKASSSVTQDVTKSNVILLIDTSSSMTRNSATGYDGNRLEAEKDALTKTNGIIDKLLANNTEEISDNIELYGINFGTGGTRAWDWSTNGTTIKNAINGLTTNSGTNWEEALSLAKDAADSKRAAEPDDNTFVILLTDGQPTTDQTRPETGPNNRHTVNTDYAAEWGYASDDARAIVAAGNTFYGVYTFGPTGSSPNCNTYNTGGITCLKSLINYAYTGTGNANSALSSDYAGYFYDATNTQALIDALEAIVDEISSSVGYTNIVMTDGLTDLTSSMKVDGKISNLTYTRSGGSYGDGTVWTNAPQATTTNGSINWDLGSTVLEDGVTYTVSFLVWPKQESYDLVADLNNGKKTYDSLTDSQKTSIVENPDGSYTLKTNTDFPTLTYSTVTTTTSNAGTETVVSIPTTIDIDNPKPVGLKNEKLTLKKIWEDSLDPSQREEVEEVVLDFYKDGAKYEKDVHLNANNDWELTNYISIAPGVMLSNASQNYNALKPGHTEYEFDGKTYIILEEGHDYYFDEHDINSHFELTNYVYHPMIVDNVLKNVFFTRDEAGNITNIEEFRGMDSVSATNTLKGGINIQKKVVDVEGNEVDTDDSFKITAHLLGTDGKPYEYDYRIYYGEKNPEYGSHIVYNDDGSIMYSRSGHIYGTGDIAETLYIGDVIRVVNVNTGVQYYVEEDEKNGYATNPTITYKEAYGTGSLVNAAQTEDGYYVVSGNTASSVTVINKFLDEKTKVDFEKTWYDVDGNVLSGKTLPGSITIELFKKGADGKKVSTGQTKKVTAGTEWKGSFTELPKYDNGVAIVYSVEESAIEGATYDDQREAFFEYDSEENNGKHAVVGRWTVMTLEDLIIKNTWKPATESVTGRTSFNIIKIDKDTKEPLSGAVFELKLKDGTVFTATTNSEGKAVFNYLDSGEYTLKETNAPEGYRSISTEPNINITKIKRLNSIDLDNLKNFYEYIFSFSTSQVDGYEYDVQSRTFTVKNEPIPYSNITAAKIWNDDDDRDGLRKNYVNYYVAVRNNSGKYVAYEKLVLEDKDNYEFKHLPLKTTDGEDISYEIVEASSCSGSGNSIKCTEFKSDNDYTATVENGVITNKHIPELINEDDDDPENDGKLTVQKIWTGEGNELVRPAAVTIELHAETINDDGEIKSWMVGQPVMISQVNDWSYTFEGLYRYDNGLEITYSVQESKLGETAFGENESTIVVYGEDNAIAGSWTKSVSGYDVTNSWKKATDEIRYSGADKFYIKKVDEQYKEMKGVTFLIDKKEKVTDEDGMVSKSVPVSTIEKEESFKFVISEKETLEGYDLVEGSAAIEVVCTSVLADTDTATLINTYDKTCLFNKTGSDKYIWNDANKTLTVVNKRSLAASLKIRKEISGITEEALIRNGLMFTLTGPEDFETQEIMFSDFERGEDGVYEYAVTGRIPTGKYTVVESNADFEDMLDLTISGDNDIEKTVGKNDKVEFVIKNSYKKIRDVALAVEKVWDDSDDRDGIRPTELAIILLRNGEEYRTIALSDKNEWRYEWTDLPRADENAEYYEYSVIEEDVDGYESDGGVLDEDAVFVFTNTHEPEPLDPCLDGGGCGGPIAPDTGLITKGRVGGATVDVSLTQYVIGGIMTVIMGLSMIVLSRKKIKK